jgi:hypothetical protein
MRFDRGRLARCDTRRRSGGRWITVLAVAAVAALGTAASASAAPSYTATVAPIGTGSYLLTVQNTGAEAITSVIFSGGEKPTNITPSSCALGNTPIPASITCTVNVAPGGQLQVCYTGAPVEELLPGGVKLLVNETTGPATTVAAVSSCPVAGFKTGSSSGTAGKCVVPKVVGKTETAAVKALSAAHCALGKVKKASSRKVKKGKVISQGTASGKSLASGSKVSLTVSKGRSGG